MMLAMYGSLCIYLTNYKPNTTYVLFIWKNCFQVVICYSTSTMHTNPMGREENGEWKIISNKNKCAVLEEKIR
jgi:hypothetical protein